MLLKTKIMEIKYLLEVYFKVEKGIIIVFLK